MNEPMRVIVMVVRERLNKMKRESDGKESVCTCLLCISQQMSWNKFMNGSQN